MSRSGGLSDTALQLREAFDRSFAVAGHPEQGNYEDVLAIRISGQAYGVRAAGATGLFKDRAIVPVPSPRPELLGLAGFRGTVVPVYDLRLLLGHPQAEPPRWLILAAGSEVLALAFESFEGQLRVAREDVVGIGPAGAPGSVEQAVRTGGVLRRLIDVPSIVEAIKGKARGAGPSKER